REERMRLSNRVKASQPQLEMLLSAMTKDTLSTLEHFSQLKGELGELYQDTAFVSCQSMGELVQTSILLLEKYPVRKRYKMKSAIV
ncbi:MAG: hypothetical protein IM575_08665, partial [Cytophagales bacterium]|nr:hypothetical protein [Cytophagales bacterium]